MSFWKSVCPICGFEHDSTACPTPVQDIFTASTDCPKCKELEAKCAEMRETLKFIREECDWESDARISGACVSALSSDCGKGWIRATELGPTIELLDEIHRNDPGDMPVLHELARLESLVKV